MKRPPACFLHEASKEPWLTCRRLVEDGLYLLIRQSGDARGLHHELTLPRVKVGGAGEEDVGVFVLHVWPAAACGTTFFSRITTS